MTEKLELVDLSQNKLRLVPTALEDCTGLRHLDLSHNCLAYLPEKLKSSSLLESLILDGNSFKKMVVLPDWLGRGPRLSHLSLEGVFVYKLAKPLMQLKFEALKRLNLRDSSLVEVDPAIVNLRSLVDLTLSNTISTTEQRNTNGAVESNGDLVSTFFIVSSNEKPTQPKS